MRDSHGNNSSNANHYNERQSQQRIDSVGSGSGSNGNVIKGGRGRDGDSSPPRSLDRFRALAKDVHWASHERRYHHHGSYYQHQQQQYEQQRYHRRRSDEIDGHHHSRVRREQRHRYLDNSNSRSTSTEVTHPSADESKIVGRRRTYHYNDGDNDSGRRRRINRGDNRDPSRSNSRNRRLSSDPPSTSASIIKAERFRDELERRNSNQSRCSRNGALVVKRDVYDNGLFHDSSRRGRRKSSDSNRNNGDDKTTTILSTRSISQESHLGENNDVTNKVHFAAVERRGSHDDDGDLKNFSETRQKHRLEKCASTRFVNGRLSRKTSRSTAASDSDVGDDTSIMPRTPSHESHRAVGQEAFEDEAFQHEHQQNPTQQQPPTSNLQRKLRIWYRQKIAPYWKITISQVFCIIYILVLTFSLPPVGIKDPSTYNIIDPTSTENTNDGVIYINGAYRPIIAMGTWQKFCLAISRMSAFSMYPMLVAVFVTKMKALGVFMSKTPFSMYLGVIKEHHDFHVHAGRYIAFDVWVHTAFHLMRWLSQGNIRLLWKTDAGISGLIAVIATPLITFPMMYFKQKMRYEVRKALHIVFFYIFAIVLCFHVPPSAIPNGGFIAPILGTCIVTYTLDAAYTYIFMTEKIETTSFHVLSSGVRISMPVSERFQKQAGRAGYAYINLPWINDKQWHPFSLFEDPKDPSVQQMFLMKNGDWTEAVHHALSRDTTRPCWIKGPFPSPYSHASLYDNQILVASGIGITPALAAINAFKSSRRINLIWVVRDPEMLEFFLEHMYLDHDGWNIIFYTGKAPLASSIEDADANIRVMKGRPQLPSLIPNVIYGCESESSTFSLWEESEEQKLCVKQLDDQVMSSWGVMYCGGSKGVLSALREISIDYNIDLHVDSFAW